MQFAARIGTILAEAPVSKRPAPFRIEQSRIAVRSRRPDSGPCPPRAGPPPSRRRGPHPSAMPREWPSAGPLGRAGPVGDPAMASGEFHLGTVLPTFPARVDSDSGEWGTAYREVVTSDRVAETAEDLPSTDSMPAMADPAADHGDAALAARRADVQAKHERLVAYLDRDGPRRRPAPPRRLARLVHLRRRPVASTTRPRRRRPGYSSTASAARFSATTSRAPGCSRRRSPASASSSRSGPGPRTPTRSSPTSAARSGSRPTARTPGWSTPPPSCGALRYPLQPRRAAAAPGARAGRSPWPSRRPAGTSTRARPRPTSPATWRTGSDPRGRDAR